MQKDKSGKLIDILLMLIILFGWIAMFSAGFGSADSQGSGISGYGFYIFGMATMIFVFVSKRRAFNERLFMGVIIFGMFSLCQPFAMSLYRCGFQTLLVGTLAFIIISHMKIEAPAEDHDGMEVVK